MALVSNFTIPQGINIAPLLSDEKVSTLIQTEDYKMLRGYVMISSFRWEQGIIYFVLDFKRRQGERTVMTKEYNFVPDNEDTSNLHTQIYDYVKTLPDFEGAEKA